MADRQPLPTLSDKGFIADPVDKIDIALAHWLELNSNQTTAFYGRIRSLQSIIADHSNNLVNIEDDIKTYLTDYLNKYVEVQEITVDGNVGEDDPESKVEISISIDYIDRGRPYTAARAFIGRDSKFELLTRTINNE